MLFKQTPASLYGAQTLWSCCYCGAVICTTNGRGKPIGACPSCLKQQWARQDAPIAMFAEIDHGV